MEPTQLITGSLAWEPWPQALPSCVQRPDLHSFGFCRVPGSRDLRPEGGALRLKPVTISLGTRGRSLRPQWITVVLLRVGIWSLLFVPALPSEERAGPPLVMPPSGRGEEPSAAVIPNTLRVTCSAHLCPQWQLKVKPGKTLGSDNRCRNHPFVSRLV